MSNVPNHLHSNHHSRQRSQHYLGRKALAAEPARVQANCPGKPCPFTTHKRSCAKVQVSICLAGYAGWPLFRLPAVRLIPRPWRRLCAGRARALSGAWNRGYDNGALRRPTGLPVCDIPGCVHCRAERIARQQDVFCSVCGSPKEYRSWGEVHKCRPIK